MAVDARKGRRDRLGDSIGGHGTHFICLCM
jgi:hypothetical protein